MRISILLLFICSISFATETRVNTLGGVGELVSDNSNVKIFPGLVTLYSNETMVEVVQPSITCLIGLWKSGVIGIDINSDSLPTIIRRAIDKMPHDETHFLPKFNIYFGQKWESFSVGLRFGRPYFYWGNMETNKFQEIEALNGSIGIRHVVDKYFMDIAGGLEMWNLKGDAGSYGHATFNAEGNISYWTRIRLLSKINEVNDFIIGIKYENYNIKCAKTGVSNREEEMLFKNREAYIGINISPVANTNIILGCLGGNVKGDTSVIDTTLYNTITTLPKIIIGIENQLNKWITARTGVTAKWITSEGSKMPEDEIETKQEKVRQSIYKLSLGWNLKFNNFELDLISEDVFLATPSISIGATYKYK